MRKYLLPQTGNYYKANLHCHTLISDGHKTPEEVKALYMKKGYSIVAYTDHDIYLPHNELTDENFLALNGFEVEINNRYGRHIIREGKTCHVCYIALDPNNFEHPLWHRSKYLIGHGEEYKDQVQFDDSLQNYVRTYTPECISEMMQIGREKGFFVTYNHPGWSGETYDYYSRYRGMHAMEIMNGAAIKGGYEDYNPHEYDDILRTGNKIYCIGADDNHNDKPDDSRYCDSGWAWTMIKAEKLDYETITKALLNGDFYASEGPEIYDLYVEDGEIHVTCSPADQILCRREYRFVKSFLAENGELLTEAVFPLEPEKGYFRITVIDERGKHACTSAYFPEDL